MVIRNNCKHPTWLDKICQHKEALNYWTQTGKMAEGGSSEISLISNSSTTLLMRLLIESLEEAFGYNTNIPRKELSNFYGAAHGGINKITKHDHTL